MGFDTPNNCHDQWYVSQPLLLFTPDLRRGRKHFYIASHRDVVSARQRDDADDLRYGQNGGT